VTDWSSEAVDILRDVIDRIIPRDADPSATDLGVDRYILQQMLAGVVPDQDLIRAGLEALSTAIREMGGRAEPTLDVRELDAMLQGAATAPWFQALVELAAEGYYADPGNGGNAGARSWVMIGYEHRLPDGPDGPPLAECPDASVRSRTGDTPDGMDEPRLVETAEHRNGG
jgi:Gluconate 2-dehydrogenase subunit 3